MPQTVVISCFQHWSLLWNPSYFPVCPSMSCYEMSSFMNVSLCLESSVVPFSWLPLKKNKNVNKLTKMFLHAHITDSDFSIVLLSLRKSYEKDNCENSPESFFALFFIATFLCFHYQHCITLIKIETL